MKTARHAKGVRLAVFRFVKRRSTMNQNDVSRQARRESPGPIGRRRFMGTCGLSALAAVPALTRFASAESQWTPEEKPNEPIGEAKGIFPGTCYLGARPGRGQVGRQERERRLVGGQVHRSGFGGSDAPEFATTVDWRENGFGLLGCPVPIPQPGPRSRRRRLSAGREGGGQVEHELLLEAETLALRPL